MERVQVVKKQYKDYLVYLDEPVREEIEFLVSRLKGKKVAMVNATAYGGGVSEKLHSLVPLLKDMGLQLDWWVIKGEAAFYRTTKTFHNRLQGQEGNITQAEIDVYQDTNRSNSVVLKDWPYDFTVIHDPQPAALIEYRPKTGRDFWIWRCHLDTSTPNPEYWRFLYRYISKYDAVIFTMPDYVKNLATQDNKLNNLTFITPSIDPLSIKNIPLDIEDAKNILARFGVDGSRPLLCQISRFDPWKDPLGVIEAYKIIKKEFPSVQLALVGSMATDDPEGWDYLYHTLRRAGEDYDIKVVTNFNGITNIEVNAFQTVSDIILQKSLREGFGLTVAEGMWKGTPVIGGNVGGIRLQIEDAVTGFLVDTVEECAEKALIILRNPSLAHDMTLAGKEKVRQELLITKNALEYLRLFNRLQRESEPC